MGSNPASPTIKNPTHTRGRYRGQYRGTAVRSPTMGRDTGSVRWHRGGWELTWWVNGKRKFGRVAGPNTRAGRRHAEDELERRAAIDTDPTIAQIIETHRAARWTSWSPSTRASHGPHAKAILDALGDRPAHAVTVAEVEDLYTRWINDGLSAGTVHRRHDILSAAMIRAERRGVVAAAVTRRVEVPTAPDMPPVDLPDVPDVLIAIDRLRPGHWLRAAARLEVATGMRRGELCALRWSDIDLSAGQVHVRAAIAIDEDGSLHRKATKSARASSVVTLDPGTTKVLTEWQVASKALAVRLGVPWARSWPVFGAPRTPNTPMDPRGITQAWSRARGRIGLGEVRWHDLRHINASELVAAGVDPKTAAERLGHDPTMLLGRYAHARPARDQSAADVIARADAVAAERRRKAG